MKNKTKQFYMDICKRTAERSHAERLKVGSVVVKNGNIIAFGYNGTPTGWDNKCERVVSSAINTVPQFVTVDEIIHAEMNAIYKLAKSNESGEGAAIFITHAPCLECSKGIFMAGIKEVYYGEKYRCNKGLDFFLKCGILVEQVLFEK